MQPHSFPSHENKKVEKLLAQLALKKAATRSQDDPEFLRQMRQQILKRASS